ncbi:MAG: TIGR03915 family putative DNA repair protein [Capnocytophaga sp.]|nr:TIGR03915 family putative DNA repair protein [Capnocytophaga sp.]
MNYLVYDGTFVGFISAVFDVYEQKLADVKIVKSTEVVPALFSTKNESYPDEQKYLRVKNKLVEYLGKSGFESLWKVMLSELPETEEVLLGTIRYALKEKKNILTDYGNLYVLRLCEILKKVGKEQHRMAGFVRFKLGKDDMYYAFIAPDYNVLPLIASHFKNRFADQKWLLYDSLRKYGIYYDLHSVETVSINLSGTTTLPDLPSIDWDENEMEFQKLWKNYFKSTNIASRKNTKLQLQYLPKRYWKYVSEKEL